MEWYTHQLYSLKFPWCKRIAIWYRSILPIFVRITCRHWDTLPTVPVNQSGRARWIHHHNMNSNRTDDIPATKQAQQKYMHIQLQYTAQHMYLLWGVLQLYINEPNPLHDSSNRLPLPTYPFSLQWRHIVHDGVLNHQRLDCLLNRFFRRRSKKTSRSCVTGLVRGIHRWPVDSPHKVPVMWKMFSSDDVIMAPLHTHKR